LRLLLERNMPWIINAADKVSTAFGRVLTIGIKDGQSLWKAFEGGGMDGMLRKLGQMTGTGSTLATVWKHIHDDSVNIARVWQTSLWPAIQTLWLVLEPLVGGMVWLVEHALKWMADHPLIMKVIFVEGVMAIAGAVAGRMLFNFAEGLMAIFGAATKAATAMGLLNAEAAGGGLTGKGAGILKTAAGATLVGAGAYEGYQAINEKSTGTSFLKAVGSGGAAGAGVGLLGGPLAEISVPVGAVGGAAIGAGAWAIKDLFGGGSKKPPGMATGGTVRTGGIALIGENGPELLHLPPAARVQPLDNGGSSIPTGNTYITLNVSGADMMEAEKVGRAAFQYLQDMTARK